MAEEYFKYRRLKVKIYTFFEETKIKSSIIFSVLIGLFLSSVCYTQTSFNGDKILGKWQIKNNRAVIFIYKTDDLYYGKIDYLKDKIVNRLGKGTIVLNKFVFNKINREWIGRVYLPKCNKFFDTSIKMLNKNTISITVHASLFSKSQTWKRVE